jgi:protein-S-isoprenylcysteine O-methyltransferase Ste14
METFNIVRVAALIMFSVFFVIISWRPLHNPKTHGFYRFFAFEGILILVLLNLPFWLANRFSFNQLISWLLLFISILFVIHGLYLLKRFGGSRKQGITPENLGFENTDNLVIKGVYRYIRHPMYSSLLFLAWGVFLKHVTMPSLAVVIITTGFLTITAKIEEQENIAFFGSDYEEYIKKTRMFVPHLL